MMARSPDAACLSDERVLAFVGGELSAEELITADAHLDTCEGCRDVVAELAHGAGGGGALPRGAEVARYLVTGILGRGAMGIVYAAYDPELDRKVALKLVRPELAGAASDRLLAEARAMAKLSHPNVVAVYDAGRQDGAVYLAMEHVEGQSLRDWFATKRPWREIREVFVAAARGLDAAHQAGLVHRDFKPENVLVADSGEVLVGDFGLALATDDDGGAAGTPAYMAPEQRRGDRADARSDQYSFCVALFEALAGRRPFEGDAPAPLDVPARVGKAIARGLSKDPDKRWENLGALIEVLEHRPVKRVRWALAVAVPAVAIGLALMLGGKAPPPCSETPAALAALWSDERSGGLGGRISAARASALATFGQSIERWRVQWGATHGAVCRATHVEKRQSERLLDVRMHCLDRALRRAEAIVAVVESRGPDAALSRVGELIDALPSSGSCATLSELTLQAPPPPKLAATVRALEDELDQTRALMASGDVATALPRALAALERARGTGHGPTIAEAAVIAAEAHRRADRDDRARALATQAMLTAQSSHADRAAVEALIALARIAARRGEVARADEHAAHAAAIATRLGEPADLVVELATVRGLLAYNRGDHRTARGHFEHAMRTSGDERSLARARLETSLGNVDRADGNLPAALEAHERALAIHTAQLGNDHPSVARDLHNIAGILRLLSRPDAARERYEQALAIKLGAYPEGHSEVALTRNSLAILHLDAGRSSEAKPLLEAALATYEATEHIERIGVLRNLALLEEREANAEQARALYQRALGHARASSHPLAADLAADLDRLRPLRRTPRAPTPSPTPTPTVEEPPRPTYMPDQPWD